MGLRGYYGRDARARALDAAHEATPHPRATTITRDGRTEWVGYGDTLLRDDGTRDVLLWGARGTTMLASTARRLGLLNDDT